MNDPNIGIYIITVLEFILGAFILMILYFNIKNKKKKKYRPPRNNRTKISELPPREPHHQPQHRPHTTTQAERKAEETYEPTWAEQKGAKEEWEVEYVLSHLPNEYLRLHDVFLKTSNGKTSQIDHIIFSPYGIFVVETKNYSGLITGYLNNKNWKQWLGKEHYPLYNPYKQNQGHIWAIQNALNRKVTDHFVNVVCFNPDAKLVVEGELNGEGAILNRHQILPFVQSYEDTVFSWEQVRWIAEKINELNITDEKVRREHIQHVQQKKEQARERGKYNPKYQQKHYTRR